MQTALKLWKSANVYTYKQITNYFANVIWLYSILETPCKNTNVTLVIY